MSQNPKGEEEPDIRKLTPVMHGCRRQNRKGLKAQFTGNFTQQLYLSGEHMMYVDPASRLQMKADLDEFFEHHVIAPSH